ncbi:MAG: type 2 isopentenyl-diphosphate Delta-isomerase [Ignavibacteriaceae bacterium]|nr:type 2 isopentenyl-diphosphate Delta-isomerase [Ignavibacteriaceae bacterium]
MTDYTTRRKKEHLELSLTADVSFKTKTNGFELYEFIHNAATEVELNKISFETKFFKKKINYPFIISCMTGGTEEAENINAELAIAAEELKIPIGVGSQRQALEDKNYRNTYSVIRKNAKSVPVLGNLGAAELVRLKSYSSVQMLIDLIEADAFVIHLNPLQELLQQEGTPNFKGLIKCLKKFIAGAGGTSWAAIEMLRNKSVVNDYFWDWGLPTSFCLRENSKLKKEFRFILIGSGGINSAIDAAKAFALGADYVASARLILKQLDSNGIEGVKKLVVDWFDDIRKIMFLTGSHTIKDLRKNKLLRKDQLV